MMSFFRCNTDRNLYTKLFNLEEFYLYTRHKDKQFLSRDSSKVRFCRCAQAQNEVPLKLIVQDVCE